MFIGDVAVIDTQATKAFKKACGPKENYKTCLMLFAIYVADKQRYDVCDDPWKYACKLHPELDRDDTRLADVFLGMLEFLSEVSPRTILQSLRSSVAGTVYERIYLAPQLKTIHDSGKRILLVDPYLELIDYLQNSCTYCFSDPSLCTIYKLVFPSISIELMSELGQETFDYVVCLIHGSIDIENVTGTMRAALSHSTDKAYIYCSDKLFNHYKNLLNQAIADMHIAYISLFPSQYSISKNKKHSVKENRIYIGLSHEDKDEVQIWKASITEDGQVKFDRGHKISLTHKCLVEAKENVRSLYTRIKNQREKKYGHAEHYDFSPEISICYTEGSRPRIYYAPLAVKGRATVRTESHWRSEAEKIPKLEAYPYTSRSADIIAEDAYRIMQDSDMCSLKTIWYALRSHLLTKPGSYSDDICKELFSPDHPCLSSLCPAAARTIDYQNAIEQDYDCDWRSLPIKYYRQLKLILDMASSRGLALNSAPIEHMLVVVSDRRSKAQTDVVKALAKGSLNKKQAKQLSIFIFGGAENE